MDPRLGRSAFINFSNPNAYVGKFPVISTVSHPTASSQIDVLAHCSSYNLPRGTKRKFDGLSLGLGNSSSSESSKQSMGTGCTISSAKGSDDGSSIDLDLNHFTLGNEGTSRLDKWACDSRRALDKPELNLELSLSSQSAITGADFTAATEYNSPSLQPYYMDLVPTVDEGSTSARRPSGCQVLSFLNKTAKMSEFSPREVFPGSSNQSQGPAPMPTLLQLPKSPVACTSSLSRPQQRSSSTKNCTYPGCMKGARGSSGRCIAHGGGRRCQKDGCDKGAEGKTIFCKAHGGGRRCEHLGCTKSAEGRTDFCIAHGGGRRCSHEGCKRAARGKSGRCIKHGGGKRCQHAGCTKSAEGRSGLCIAHGGGRRCQQDGCGKGAQGSTNFCKAHGGGKRCTHPDCKKGAEGSTAFCKGHGGGKRCSAEGCTKSVHGGTLCCVAHGGGKRCVVEGCTKSARGRTDRCVGHGGGKRCQSSGCDKSAQGSTNFCKAHGGGKRCLWGHEGSDHGAGDTPCERLARGKNGLCVYHNPQVDENRVHGGFSVVSDALSQGDRPSNTETSRRSIFSHPMEAPRRVAAPADEGRVHGGNILSMFANGMSLGKHPANQAEASTSAPRNSKSTNGMVTGNSAARGSWL
uniref:WRKY19-like zinc finger domain-containing protein n=1 Tax=Oryza glumipatula TaxID=40148 RepID=A0A0D9YQ37_9ORYZ